MIVGWTRQGTLLFGEEVGLWFVGGGLVVGFEGLDGTWKKLARLVHGIGWK